MVTQTKNKIKKKKENVIYFFRAWQRSFWHPISDSVCPITKTKGRFKLPFKLWAQKKNQIQQCINHPLKLQQQVPLASSYRKSPVHQHDFGH
jgi:hypothetical protein